MSQDNSDTILSEHPTSDELAGAESQGWYFDGNVWTKYEHGSVWILDLRRFNATERDAETVTVD